MADYREPAIAEDIGTLIGTATWAFNNDNGFTHDNTVFAGGAITLVNPALPGVCTFPLFTPPTFTNWLTSTEAVVGVAEVEISTPYQPTFQDLTPTMVNLSPRGDECTLRCNLPAGANSLATLIITYAMSFSSITDVEYLGQLSREATSQRSFSTAEIRMAIRYANAKVLYLLKDWADFYTARIDTQVRRLLIEAEAYYALEILFEIKSRQMLNLTDGDRFSVGDINVDPAPGAQKELSALYVSEANKFKLKGNELMLLVIPPGTDEVRSTFYFDTCKSSAEVDAEDTSGGIGSVE